jgi:very-short-patch-repair endonuclease
VTRPTASRHREQITVHRGSIRPDEIGIELGIPVTSVPRTVLDLAAILSRRQMERGLHEIEVQGLTDRLSLPDLLERYPRRSGAVVLRELLASSEPTGVTQNDLEELFATFLDAHGLPRPLFNGTLPIRGRLLRPDCMWHEERLLVELDGRAVHGTDRAFEGDRQRDRILLAEGWRSTRVTWRQLRDEPASIAADLGELLRVEASPPTL